MEDQTSFNPQEREETNRSKNRDEGSVRSSVFSAKPSESGYGSATASVRSGQDQSKSGSGSGSGTGSSKSKSLNSDSASASTINSSQDCPKSAFGKDSLKKRSFKSLKPPTPIAPAFTEDSKAADFQSSLSQGQKTPSRKASRALQAVALSRALDCIQNISHVPQNVDSEEKERVRSVLLNPKTAKKVAKEVKLGLKEKGRDWRALLGPDIVTDMSQSFAFLEKDPAVKRKDCFITAISLDTGCVVYVTTSMTEKLLFHTDMWTGRSLLDFLHPKDRLVFTNHVTSGLMGSPASSALTNSEIGDPTKQSLCVRFRFFKSFKSSGFAITEKKTSYAPFKLNLKVHKEDCNGNLGGSSGSEQLYMLIQATPIHSAYSHSDQTFSTGQFSLRHTSSSAFNEVDSASIPLLGHLPQDLIGSSALDFYLPADLGIVRDTYTAVLQRQGKPVRSMPFHFLAQNGCYVLLETDWSCFINPWSKKLEFVVGNHRVIKGPSNPDVFASPPDPGGSSVLPLSEESLQLISEIKDILGGNAPICSPKRREEEAGGAGDPLVHRRRRRELAILMGSLLDKVTRAQTVGSARSNSAGSPLCDLSAVVGEMSPHRGSSTESFDTPVSYSQLNYNENIERYFLSQPKLVPSESSQEKAFGKMNSSSDNSNTSSGGTTSNDDPSMDKGTRSAEWSSKTKCYSGQAKDSQSQLLSSENNSASGSGEMPQSVISGNKENYHGPELTTETLQRHSAEMERDFMEQAKVIRLRSLGRDRKDRVDRRDSRAVKRGVGSSWDDGSGGDHQFKHPNNAVHHLSPSFPPMGVPLIPVTLWPPFSLSATSGHYPAPVYTTTSHGSDGFPVPAAGASTVPTQACMPSYYLSQPSGSGTPQVLPQLYMQHQGSNLGMPYMGGMMAYQQVYIPQTYMIPSIPFAPQANTVDNHGRVSRESVLVERCGTSCQGDAGTVERAASDYPSVDEGGLSNRDPAELDPWSNVFGYKFMQEGPEDHSHRMDEYMKGQSELSDSSGNGLWQDSGRQVLPPIRSTPPWMQSVKSTPDLVYRYQVPSGPSLAEVLERDRASLQQLHQPGMLNDQLVALYREFDDEEMRTRMLNIEEGGNTTSSSCFSGEEQSSTHKKKPRRRDDFRRSMIYEENASLPAPDSG